MKEKYYIYLSNIRFEVTESEYKKYYKELEHSKYLKKQENNATIVSYENLSDDLSGEDIIADTTVNVEETAIHNIMLDKLQEALKTLNDDELDLIDNLIYQEKSEREYSDISGIKQKTINNHRHNVLAKLRKILES